MLDGTVIVSDGAGQFDVGEHALCWVPAERLVHKLDAFTEVRRVAKEAIRFWDYLGCRLGVDGAVSVPMLPGLIRSG